MMSNKMQHTHIKRSSVLLPSRAQSDRRTYLIRDENRDGQMSEQNTASVSTGLRGERGQTGRRRSPRSRSDSKGKTQRCLLDSEAASS